ncbi:MAG: hypothetical protein M0P19_11345 [Nevskia sp.]|jgi:hypothetical protein|nr:hypothetical protein [Nevskia sp.]MCK9384664.1 hypothetical protein [Nevskia sp.]
MVTQLQQSAAVYRAIWKQKVLVSRASGFNDERLPAAKNGVEQGKKSGLSAATSCRVGASMRNEPFRDAEVRAQGKFD